MTDPDLHSQTLERVVYLLRDRELSELERAKLALQHLEAQTHLSREDVLAAFGYSDARLKTPLLALHEFGRVMRGDLGQRVTLGYPSLDEAMRGMRPGQVGVIMARAGVGKTTLLLNVAANIFEGETPHPILFLSLEMAAAEVAARLFALSTHQRPREVESWFSRSGEGPSILAWMRKYQYFIICDRSALTLEQISKRITEAGEGTGLPVPLVMIDYLQLIGEGGSSAYERVSAIARGIKGLAKKHSCTILAASQTSREGGTGGERVTLNMARESGWIEEAADFLIGCWRPELAGNGGREEELMACLLKNRHGPREDVSLRFDKTILRITEA